MTAEEAILNKSAVALAADSAVTISLSGSKRKTYTANKLFTLSKYHPVGAMFFGNAEILGVPWETILKRYRGALGSRSFDTIDAYADNFLDHLRAIEPYFPEAQQRRHFQIVAFSCFQRLAREIQDEQEKSPDEPPGDIERRLTQQHCDFISEKPVLRCVQDDFPSRLMEAYGDEVSDAFDLSNLKSPNLPADMVERIKLAVVRYCAANPSPSWKTGLVFAGFGESQIFPAIRTVSCNLIALNTVVYADDADGTLEISHENEAALVPFAQRDVVKTFLEGIKPEYRRVIDEAITTVFDGLPTIILEKLGGLGEDKRLEISGIIANNTAKAKKEFFERLNRKILKGEIAPLLDVMEAMPKDELAQMAEALVNLTSVKRKMSHDLETVGGPIDVAVISKGDGFIWMSRKHYFNPELNIHFARTYFER